MDEILVIIFKIGELVLNFASTIANRLTSDYTGEDEQDQTANGSR